MRTKENKGNSSNSRRIHGGSARVNRKGLILALIMGGVLASSVVAGATMFGSSVNPSRDQDVLVMHIHSHLTLIIDGRQMLVPANIGIDPTLHKSHLLDQFGTKNPPIPPIHTHTDDGLIHVESTAYRNYTLGEFLDVWGVSFGPSKTVSLTVNGHPDDEGQANGGYRNHVLSDGEDLVLAVN